MLNMPGVLGEISMVARFSIIFGLTGYKMFEQTMVLEAT
jgi:hypothetical protein